MVEGFQAFEIIKRVNDDAQGDIIVDLGTVYIKTSGEMYFVPSRNLDHSDNDPIVADLTAIVTDGDGDTLAPKATIKIADGQLPEIISVVGVRVSESNLEEGTSFNSALLTDDGAIFATAGSDDIDHYEVAASAIGADLGITSNNEIVKLGTATTVTDMNGNVTHYVYKGVTETSSTEVFELRLNVDGSYEFTLKEPVDHTENPNATDPSDPDFVLSFDIPVVAVDSDNDPSLSASLNIQIVDDEPIVSPTPDPALEVIEPVTVGDTQTATHNFISQTGADGAVVKNVTFGDAEFALVQTDTGFQSFAVGSLGTGFVKTTGEFYFEPNRDLDHTNETPIDLSLKAEVLDGDGDSLDASVDIRIVDGQIPVITDTYEESDDNISFNEANLSDGNTPNPGAVTQAGTIVTTVGSDNIDYFEIEPSLFNTDNALKSNGKVVQLELDPDASSASQRVYQGFTIDGANKTPVFIVTLDKPALGKYEVTLLQELDHEAGAGTNSLTFDLPVFAVDTDGDRSTTSPSGNTPIPAYISVDVIDDIPELQPKSIDRVEGDRKLNVYMFDTDGDKQADTEGADNGVVISFKAQNDLSDPGRLITFTKTNNARDPLGDEIDLNGSAKTVVVIETVTTSSGQEVQELGVLKIWPDGQSRFTPRNEVDHSRGEDLSFVVDVTARDFDQDESTAPLTITVSDQDGSIGTATARGVEEAGQAGASDEFDNLVGLGDERNPIFVTLEVELNDRDRGEQVGDIRIDASGHNGTFFYEDTGGVLQELVPNADGIVTLQAANVDQSISQPDPSSSDAISQINNLYYVPNRHYSTGKNGVNLALSIDILNTDENGMEVVDHTVANKSLNINIESIADKPTFTMDSASYYVGKEDSSDIKLDVKAKTLDTSNPETITYTINFTEGGDKAVLKVRGRPVEPSDPMDPNSDYIISSKDIGRVTIDPIDHFSGQIRLDVVATATEKTNVFDDKGPIDSETFNIVIDVEPSADSGKLKINRGKVFEDGHEDFDYTNNELLTLDQVIRLTPTVDMMLLMNMPMRMSQSSIFSN
ncbi:RTX toxins and related Ca2+-binding proteins [Vibrio astriarenae]|nr:RTX toxins and related Ca2+-binding proteins [Vibrio sp. C7]